MIDPITTRPRMSIGVCGESGAGKTVFLTCLFQTLLSAVPEEYIVHYDPNNYSNNALYFDSVEETLRKTGKTDGTPPEALHPITMLVTPASSHAATSLPPLAVDLMDFAGGTFHALAAVSAALEDVATAESRAALQQVHSFVDNADAFVILISAADLKSLTPRQGAFTASVNTLLALCRLRRKPVALLLSQADRVSPSAVQEWTKSPRVEAFKRHFSAERGASAHVDGRPFGLVDALTCYEEIRDGLEPKRQSSDNSIWRPDAAHIVYRLIEEAAPSVRARFEATRRQDAVDEDGLPRVRVPNALARTRAADIAIDKPRKLVIAVCGAQGAGKTVFLTCLFRTFKYHFADDVSASFARESSDAPYFQAIESEIAKDGSTAGTTPGQLPRVELTLAPRTHLDNAISVELMDFAGRHFRAYASASASADDGADAEGQKGQETVRAFVDKADAFVILISAVDVDPQSGVHRNEPFGPSVELVLEHALQKQKPVALLFSQADRAPHVNHAVLRQLPDVRDFERRFASGLREAAAGVAPFGVARPISCYDTGPGRRRPDRQAATGSIWRLEPAEIVTSLVRAVVLRFRRELEAEREAEAKADAEKQRLAKEEEQARLEKRRLRRWQIAAGVCVLALTIAIAAILAIRDANRRQAERDAQTLEQAASAIRSRPVLQVNVDAVTRVLRKAPVDESPVLRTNAAGLQQAIVATGEQLDGNPRLDAQYADDVARWSDAVDLLRGKARTSIVAVHDRLAHRLQFVQNWLTAPPPTDDWGRRWGFLRTETARFAASDKRFAEYLTSIALDEKRATVERWRRGVATDTDVIGEINRVQGLLQHARNVLDDDYMAMARSAGATSLVQTVLSRRDNSAFVANVIQPLVPDLAGTPAQQLQFRELTNRAFSCGESSVCRPRVTRVNVAIERAVKDADSVAGAMQNAWGSLLPPVRNERLALWAVVADALANAYYFDTNAATWPGGMEPLSAQVRRLIAYAEQTGWDPSDELKARLIRPFYCDEMLYLRRGLVARDNHPSPYVSVAVREAVSRCRPLRATR